MRRSLCVFSALLAALVTRVTSADDTHVLYKSVDGDGHSVYSDRPRSGKDEVVIIPKKTDNSGEVQARIAKESAALANADRALRERLEQERAKRADKEKLRRDQAEKCSQARSRVRTLDNERLVFSYDAKGNRVYPSEAELKAQRIAARRDMEQLCE